MEKKRYIILDALRGFAILGIIMANFPEFSLRTFGDPASHTASDKVVQALLTFFVDGKFYTLFSLLFGMGFAIQLENAQGKLRRPVYAAGVGIRPHDVGGSEESAHGHDDAVVACTGEEAHHMGHHEADEADDTGDGHQGRDHHGYHR